MRHIDIFILERERATVLPNGCKALVEPNKHGANLLGYFWLPKAKKPALYQSFASTEKAIERFKQCSANYDAHLVRKAADKAARVPGAEALAKANPGAIFRTHWGYAQTNIDYFQVVKRSGQMVTIAAIGCEILDGGGPSSETIRPVKNAFIMKCGHPVTKWDGTPGICGRTENARSHDIERPDLSREYCGQDPHTYVPVLDTQVRRVGVGYNGEPSLNIDGHGGSLVKQIAFGNAEPLIVGTDSRTAFGWGH